MSVFLEDLRLNPYQFELTQKVIKIHGPDAAVFLNTQTTNNVTSMGSNTFHWSSLLNLAGKIVSSFILVKEDDKTFYLILPAPFLDQTIERIEKFHISEEFEIETVSKYAYLTINSDKGQFIGRYFFHHESIDLFDSAQDAESVEHEKFRYLKMFMGVPTLGEEVKTGELINNTLYDELSVDYHKGCYLGQETVSKINSRRGAAYKPVLVELTQLINLENKVITKNNKKIGTINSQLQYQNKTYLQVATLREYRIENYKLAFECDGKQLEGTVHLYPYLDLDKSDLAVELYDMAMESFHTEDYQQAVKYFEKAIEIKPDFEDAYESLGVLHGRLGDYKTAIALMEKLGSINPDCMMALTNLSLYHMKLGNIETAEKYKADATVLNFKLLGDEAERKKREEEQQQIREADLAKRISMFKEVLEMDYEDAMANNGMGEIELARDNYLRAEKYFKRALQTDPKYSAALLGLSKVLVKAEKKEEAKHILARGIEVASKKGDLMPANEMQSMLLNLN